MKKIILILFACVAALCVVGQADSDKVGQAADTTNISAGVRLKRINQRTISDTFKRLSTDTLADSLSGVANMDSANVVKSGPDSSLQIAPVTKKPIDSLYLKLLNNPFTRSNVKPTYLIIKERERVSKDEIFYMICGLLLCLAFIKMVFSRYFKNIFKLFFQPAFRHRQTREQLLQNNLPSLLLNFFFILSGGVYVSFVLKYYNLSPTGFWTLWLYTTALLLVLYSGKFIFLSFAGWVFNVKEASNAYIFAVYLINKILGIILIPFIILIAFSPPLFKDVSVTISLLITSVFFIYRYFISYAPVSREIKVSFIHFFLYILAFEIIPLLVIYKTLMIYLDNTL